MNCFVFQQESCFQNQHPKTNLSLTTKQTTISNTNSYSLNSFSCSVSSPSADSLTIDTAESHVGPVSRVAAAATTYEADSSCDLNLTLASSTLQANWNPYSARTAVPHHEFRRSRESKSNDNGKEFDMMVSSNHRNGRNGDTNLSSSKEASNNFQAPTAAIARVNDLFWERFLTERPNNQEPAAVNDVLPAVPARVNDEFLEQSNDEFLEQLLAVV
ncbi:hypothetical protein JCGZ_01902 [Jatropha curcas]|uniref:Uncharacterized protein n=1 Tax=Jatropha curcas TaxID=180498 RepID=A0A067LDE7_JATCU|nr:hypothetical protein JCGZ_01902 [Jatropha curcas]